MVRSEVHHFSAQIHEHRARKRTEEFLVESATIERLAGGLSEKELSERRLVPASGGLEDSSRYLSAVMAVQHL